MPKCSYCKKMYESPKGLTFIKTDGTILHLCSSKCRKNMLMKRRKVRWILKTKKNKKEKQEELKKHAKEKIKEESTPSVPEKNK